MKIFMDAIDPREKTIGFRATQLHALAEQHLRDFQDNEKTIPTVLTTSQKPSTGVDARNVRHIVLMRSINSMIEFKQIIGRGTFRDPEWDGEPVEPQPRVLTTHGNPPPAEGERAPANRGRGEAASKDQGAPAPAHDGQLVL